MRGITTLLLHNLDDIIIYLLFSLLLFYFKRDKNFIAILAIFSFAIINLIYSVYVGGDFVDEIYGGNRFVTVSIPFIIICFVYVFSKICETYNISLSVKQLVLIGMILIIAHNKEAYVLYFKKNFPMLKSDIYRAKLGLILGKYIDKNHLIGVHAAGNIPYFSECRCIDLLGKSDKIIAHSLPKSDFRPGHNKWNYIYSLIFRKPILIADNWGKIDEFISKLPYKQLSNGSWVELNYYYNNRKIIDEMEKELFYQLHL
jgi:hypothetical protein